MKTPDHIDCKGTLSAQNFGNTKNILNFVLSFFRVFVINIKHS